MAVVYADLRFTRAPGQDPGVTQEREDENWDITYENVTVPRPRDQTQPLRTCPRGVTQEREDENWDITYENVTVPRPRDQTQPLRTCPRVSQVSELQRSAEADLQQLEREYDQLSSRSSQNNARKDSMIEKLRENQMQSQHEVQNTLSSLYQVQNQMKTIAQEMERTRRDKENTESSLRSLQDDLQTTKTQLEGKQDELSRCEKNLKLVNTQKKTSESTLTQTRSNLRMTQGKLKDKEDDLLLKEKELSNVKKSLQETQNNLEANKRYSEEQKKTLNDLQQRISEAEKCFTRTAGNPSDGIDFCPPGWHQIGALCYYLSTQKKSRIFALGDCEGRSATLAKVEDEMSILPELIRRSGGSYWIGLHNKNGSWEWPDRNIKRDFETKSPQICVKASPLLSPERCSIPLPWICEMRTMVATASPEALRCMGEKMGMIGENHQEQ
ncbi:uncharacterized protein ACNLHF_021997 isoform 2-T2 [Anomaloglossus baeobatrachus]